MIKFNYVRQMWVVESATGVGKGRRWHAIAGAPTIQKAQGYCWERDENGKLVKMKGIRIIRYLPQGTEP